MSLFKISGGTVYDPLNNIDGEVRDLWIDDGRFIEPPTDSSIIPDRTLDASGLVVMPGGVDMHCHIAGPKVNVARKMRPEEKRLADKVTRTPLTRSGTMGSVPSTFATGYKYAGLGYTTAFDAAIPPLGARHAHEEFHDTPILDKGFYILVGNNHYVMRQIQEKEPERLKNYLAWLLNATKGYSCKLVNPGGVEVWKSTGGNATGLDDPIDYFDVTPRQIITGVAHAAGELGLPHPVHIHCNNLGMPGNWLTTLETMKALEGRKAHITHIQFHSYGGNPDEQSTFCSQVPQLADYVNSHENLTVDVGQVMFAETTSMTGDGPLGYFLHKVTGRKWFSGDTEMEAGCGIVPIVYKDKSMVHALQWAIGLEWYLLVNDPWRVAMSTDHPNGASFMAYPEIIALLMDRERRRAVLDRVPSGVKERCSLADLDREYTLNEIAIVTRAAPAKMLGLTQKGHLGPGADADITIYTPDNDIQLMFELPRFVIRRGRVIVEQGEIRENVNGETLHVAPSFDPDAVDDIQNWFEQHYTIQFANYPVQEDTVEHLRAIPTE
ncbi:Formyltransferase/hydrolase complex Fhc subunit A [Symmachiella dynata]|uniref:Formyltransferase/hydrolase complex Fhc subunit A n=1 Tax=Symmachiella dynata TaxID=2527995 RepID=A0A517ZME0_9PLAN|nr:formylmethanofuran dehydrogenase subunit A [Symmachiella dynata]QDU43650.1 Formyltransferase/hydrolase complex Fhc subunit A [Symmachiella dynata]